MSSAVASPARPVERVPGSPVEGKDQRARYPSSSSNQSYDNIQAAKASSSYEPPPSPPAGNVIDMETFRQILELDEGDDREFSAGMASAYFSQAQTTFTEMDDALRAKDLAKLSSLGHFLKGSSAALGVSKVQASCERMQHYGQKRDEEADRNLTDEEALTRIETLLAQVKSEYGDAETWLKAWYTEDGDTTFKD